MLCQPARGSGVDTTHWLLLLLVAVSLAQKYWLPLLLRQKAKSIAAEEIREVADAMKAAAPDAPVDEEVLCVAALHARARHFLTAAVVCSRMPSLRPLPSAVVVEEWIGRKDVEEIVFSVWLRQGLVLGVVATGLGLSLALFKKK